MSVKTIRQGMAGWIREIAFGARSTSADESTRELPVVRVCTADLTEHQRRLREQYKRMAEHQGMIDHESRADQCW